MPLLNLRILCCFLGNFRDGEEENPVAGSNFLVKVCLPRRACTHLEGFRILSFILSFGVVFIEDVCGLVLFYVERSDFKGQRSPQISSELIWVTVAGGGRVSAADAAIVSGCPPHFVCITFVLYIWLGHVTEISSAIWELGFEKLFLM
jgi:hypothetical protein